MKGIDEDEQPQSKTRTPFVEVREDEVKQKVVKARGWLLTVPADEYTQEQIEGLLSKYSYIGQLERGKNTSDKNPDGYLHYQLYIEVENAIRFSTLKKMFPNAHLEIRKGTVKQAYEYCSKTETRVSEPFSNGDLSVFIEKSMKLSDYIDLFQRGMGVADIIASYPSAIVHLRALEGLHKYKQKELGKSIDRTEMECHYLWGSTGVGKTHLVTERHGIDNVFIVTDYDGFPFDNYDGEPVILFDEFRGQIKITNMLRYLDPYKLELRARFFNNWAQFTTVYVVSNIALTAQYPHVNHDEPETWLAFANRFHTVTHMKGKNWREENRKARGFTSPLDGV